MSSSKILAFSFLLLWIGAASKAAAFDAPISADTPPETPIGRSASHLQEAGARLTVEDAVAAYERGRFEPSGRQVLSFGIGPDPVWIHFTVHNATPDPLRRRLSIETPWLDRVEVYVRHGGRTAAAYRGGDREPFGRRDVNSRYLAHDHVFSPGVSDVFVRVQTPDPMVVPIYLLSLDHAEVRENLQDYSYGFLYGFLFALLAYNAMLFAGLREPRYILYSLYLGMFLLMNVSYTGHGFRWLWPMDTTWAQWSNPILMVCYGASGLGFALSFLRTRTYFPRAHKAVLGFLAAAFLLLLVTVVLERQREALVVAFTFVTLFTAIMLWLGLLAAHAGQKPARYFLLAAICAMAGAAVTALATWGLIPFGTWTFRAVEIGMLLDATLLALALTYQFRVGQVDKLHAQKLATLDPLTGINNRRAFYDKAAPIWSSALRREHDLSVILLDIDHFKRINDAYGHGCGDDVLAATAKVLTRSIRDQDVVARWGGEEFILLLPETGHRDAVALAERLRVAIAGVHLPHFDVDIAPTASFGVAQRQAQHRNLDALISSADRCLYHAKDLGRDRVHYGPFACAELDAAGSA